MLPPLFNKLSALLQKRPRSERRGAKRLTPGALSPCQIRVTGEDEPVSAWIHNLSKTGVSLLAPLPVASETMIQILIVNAAHTFALAGEVRIVRCTRIVSGDYLIGGEFTNELQHDQMTPFIL